MLGMQSIDKIITELERDTRAKIEAMDTSNAVQKNFSNYTKTDYLRLIKNECLAMDASLPTGLSKKNNEELSEIYSRIKTESIKEKNFYIVFLSAYEIMIGGITGDKENAEMKVEKFKNKSFYELREKYNGAMSFKNTVRQINECQKDGLDMLISWFEERANQDIEITPYWEEIELLTRKIEAGDIKWIASRYGKEDISNVVVDYYGMYNIRIPKIFNSFSKNDIIQEYLQIAADNSPETEEDCKEKAFYVIFLASYSRMMLPIYHEVKSDNTLKYLTTEELRKKFELYNVDALKHFYYPAMKVKSIIRQINSK